MRIFFAGDIVGSPGRSVLAKALPALKKRFEYFDFVIVNCENAASGKGMTDKVMDDLFSLGVDGMTSGNHIWDKNIFYPTIASETRVIRPANYPPGTPGAGYSILERDGKRVGILNLQGRVYMPPLDCPFRVADSALIELEKLDKNADGTPLPVLVDFHAEATSEKKAIALYLDGQVSALVGTHTHVQTADEQVLPGGSAYITDVGMTGGHGGVIGVHKEAVLSRFTTCLPAKHEVCDKDLRINAVVIDIDDATARAVNIVRINEPAADGEGG